MWSDIYADNKYTILRPPFSDKIQHSFIPGLDNFPYPSIIISESDRKVFLSGKSEEVFRTIAGRIRFLPSDSVRRFFMPAAKKKEEERSE